MKIYLIFFGNKKQCHWRELFFINTQFFVCLFYFEKILYLCSNKKTTMTELKFKNSIDDVQISKQALPFSTGMWVDYNIDDKTLRAKAYCSHSHVL